MSLFILASAMSARACPSVAPADAAIRRFAPACRAAVARLAAGDPRLGDLAVSFPGLLHRLAMRPDARGCVDANELVLRGGSLKEAAALAETPFWTRRLPAEAFGARARNLPDGEWFSRRIGNCLPKERRHAARWLDAVTQANLWCGEDFALWIARECARAPRAVERGLVPATALFAWYSMRPGLLGGALAEAGWAQTMRFKPALERAREWLSAVELAVEMGRKAYDPWLEPAEVDGFDFTPVATREDLVDEAKAMRNCLRTYGGEISHDWERIWSVRRQGERVATLSVAFSHGAPFPQISELKGPGNSPASTMVWLAVRRWLGEQCPPRPATKDWGEAPLDRDVWVEIWRPYWLANRRLPAELPLAPSREALRALRHPRRRLARHRRRA